MKKYNQISFGLLKKLPPIDFSDTQESFEWKHRYSYYMWIYKNGVIYYKSPNEKEYKKRSGNNIWGNIDNNTLVYVRTEDLINQCPLFDIL